MRYLIRLRVLQVPHVSSCAASSFCAGKDGGGISRRQGRERIRDGLMHNNSVNNRVSAKATSVRMPAASSTRENVRMAVKKTELLFPDAQTHELGDMGVADEHERVMLGEQPLLQEEEEEEMHAPPNLKRRYDSFLRPKREAVVLKSSFADRMSAGVDEEEDVTRFYSRDEVAGRLADGDSSKTNAYAVKREVVPCAKSFSRVSDKLKDDEEDLKDDGDEIHRRRAVTSNDAGEADECENRCSTEKSRFDTHETKESVSGDNWADWGRDDTPEKTGKKKLEGAEDGGCDESFVDTVVSQQADDKNEFENVRKHPFFANLILRLEKNALRQRQQIKSNGCYNLEAVNLCLRPLLQLTDYPFTIRQLSQVASFLYPTFLRRSLLDIKACRRLHIYHSVDTDVVLDWSVEDFLRRRYESIHLSWEPVKIVILRFGWNQDVMSDRDCMLYFSRFQDYIELAELELSAADNKPRAIPIVDAVLVAEQRPIPVSRLLIRRKPVEDTEPSVTEAIRLMGKPALVNPAKSRKAQSTEKDTVEGTFERIQREAASVDGDDAARLRHAIDTVPSLNQASHPSGHSIKDFSLGKEKNAVLSQGLARSFAKTGSNSFDEGRCAYTPKLYEALANAYHKKKVEASQLRRRLLNTDSIDYAAELREKLSLAQKELPRLRERLEKLRHLQRIEKEELSTMSHDSFSTDDKHNNNNKMHVRPVVTTAVAAESSFNENSSVEISKRRPDSSRMSSFTKSDFIEEKAEENRNATECSPKETELTDMVVKNETGTYDHADHHNLPRSEEIKSLSSAALMLRQEIANLQEKRRHEEEVLFKKMEEAVGTLLKIEATMCCVSQREAIETEKQQLEAQREQQLQREETEKQLKREQAEARARAVEEELLRKHKERVKVLSKQREEARQAQREAEIILERQKLAEQAALEAEEELERKLKEAKSKIWSNDVDVVPTSVSFTSEPKIVKMSNNSATIQSVTPEVPRTQSPSVSNTNNTTTEPLCTPEQYDGLCLGAERLRKEIMELERQMESEGDEDDMTLMAVLATLRSELEELEDFIRLVRQRESWAAERDKARKDEAERLAKERGTRPNDLQEKISAIRFQIDLMEKRLQHASERHVISKLEQRIINGRREISRLRVEQDRLRRSGLYADAGGIYVPPSISIAKTLAEAEAKDAEAVSDVAANADHTKNKEATLEAQGTNKMHVSGEEMKERCSKQFEIARGTENSSVSAGEHHANNNDDNDDDGDGDGADGVDSSMSEGPLQSNDEELRQLSSKMEIMLQDIKQLEDNIASTSDGRNAETTAALLAELQEKLQQLLEVRDAIRRRTGSTLLDGGVPNNTGVTTAPVAGAATKTGKPAAQSGRSAVIAPPSNRPVSGHATRAGEEVLHFERFPKTNQHSASHHFTAARRKMKKITKPKKSCR